MIVFAGKCPDIRDKGCRVKPSQIPAELAHAKHTMSPGGWRNDGVNLRPLRKHNSCEGASLWKITGQHLVECEQNPFFRTESPAQGTLRGQIIVHRFGEETTPPDGIGYASLWPTGSFCNRLRDRRMTGMNGCDDGIRNRQCHAAEILDVEPKICGG